MSEIQIVNASENNLKNVDVCIPHNKFTVVTGLSGSGKSSLLTDVLYREGQRMYFETFSSYTRSRLGKIRPAKVDSINGMLPVVSVGQTHVLANRRSTAGTFSEISPLLRQLFSRYNDQQLKFNRNEFSFNSNQGWCPHCKGLGIEEFIDIAKIVANPQKSLRQGALVITLPNGYTIYSQVTIDELDKVCQHYGFSVDTPWYALTEQQKDIILNGSNSVKVLYGKHSLESRLKWTGITARPRDEGYYKGIVPVMEDILRRDRNDNILRFVSSRVCSVCGGNRLKSSSLAVTWKGQTISYYEALPMFDLLHELKSKTLTSKGEQLLINSIAEELQQLCRLSVGHIACNRMSETLSQGELRHMRLAQLSTSGLTGVLYLFDEPSIGLHQRDVHSLIDTMYSLVHKGNTVVVVEHNEQIIRAAQHLIEMGPGAGQQGGDVIFSGTVQELSIKNKLSTPTKQMLTNGFLVNKNGADGRTDNFNTFDVYIDKIHNINKQTFTFARNALNVVTGVSGAGKSTMVNHGLLAVSGFNEVLYVNQKPIGRTSRSNAATYTGLFDVLRKLFAKSSFAQEAKLTASHFSFNSKQGQCEACLGTGVVKTGMHIFEDLVQPCPVCGGSRYKPDVLGVKVNGLSIAQVLDLTVSEAKIIFAHEPNIMRYLHALDMLGLGYLHLGQSSTTLSGGEAQRVKLASVLYQPPKGHCLFVLDEPTTGLHAADVNRLVEALRQFQKMGHTVVVVEHDKQLIMEAQWIVDIGPEGGVHGGKSLFCGPTSSFLSWHQSPTTRALMGDALAPNINLKGAESWLRLRNITTHNLKHIDIDIKAGEIVVFTGVSGSGKTSLLMHTLHAEGQRLFTENLSAYKRLQIKMNNAAQVERVLSIMPTVAVEADPLRPDIQSTVATVSGVYDNLRLLFARFAHNPDGSHLSAVHFSLTNEQAVCKTCEGVGYVKRCRPYCLVVDESLPLLGGALLQHKTVQFFVDIKNKYRWSLLAMAKQHNIDLSKPWNQLAANEQNLILWGTGNQEYTATWEYKRKANKGVHTFTGGWLGLCNYVEQEYRQYYPSAKGKNALELLTDELCDQCKGQRLNQQMLLYKVNGHSIGKMLNFSVDELLAELNNNFYLDVSQALLAQLRQKLEFMSNAGLGYLVLGKPARWLSTGELKWIQLGSVLSMQQSGMCIILDEPTWGFDTDARKHLVSMLKTAQQRGNTLLVSDYSSEILTIADRVIELGPLAGAQGGQIVANIKPLDISPNTSSVAAAIVDGGAKQVYRKVLSLNTQPVEEIRSATIYSQRINLITGRVGSGKSTMIQRITEEYNTANNGNVICVSNKLPYASTQSAVATRTGILADLKKAFAKTPEAKSDGRTESDFGFNSKSWQCPRCKGLGYITTTLDFLPDVKEVCPECNGNRYRDELLGYRLHGMNIGQWLSCTVDELSRVDFISKKSKAIIKYMQLVGLGYLSIGQEISTLSLGERRRLMLAESLSTLNGQSLIVYDSPTRGLDWGSIGKLFQLFDQLVADGHTVVIADVEEVKPLADFVIEVGKWES